MSHSLGTISVYIRSFTTLPAALLITTQELLQLASVCFYSDLHLQSQNPSNPPRIRLPRLQTYLIIQSIACIPSATHECYCKCATSALLVEGCLVSTFLQTVTSRRYLDSAHAGRLAAGCPSSGELSPPTPLQTATTEDKSILIFTSVVSIKHGWFPNNPEILYEPENRYRLQFHGTADNGR